MRKCNISLKFSNNKIIKVCFWFKMINLCILKLYSTNLTLICCENNSFVRITCFLKN